MSANVTCATLPRRNRAGSMIHYYDLDKVIQATVGFIAEKWKECGQKELTAAQIDDLEDAFHTSNRSVSALLQSFSEEHIKVCPLCSRKES